MKARIVWFGITVAQCALLYAALFLNVQGAWNVYVAMQWVLCLCALFIFLITIADLDKTPPKSSGAFVRMVNTLRNTISLFLLFWFGHWVVALVLLVSCVLIAFIKGYWLMKAQERKAA